MRAGDFVIGAMPYASIASAVLVFVAFFGPFPLLVLIPQETNLPIVTIALFGESSNLLPFAEIDNIRVLSTERQCSCATQLYQGNFGKLQ